MLDENSARFSRSKKEHHIDSRNVNSLIEDIDGKEDFQIPVIVLQIVVCPYSFSGLVLPGKKSGVVIIAHVVGHHSGMLNVSAECKCLEFLAGSSVLLYLLMYEIAIFGRRDLGNQLPFGGLGQPVIDKVVTYAIIVKRNDKVVDDSVAKSKFVGNVVVEQTDHILVVHTVFRGRQTKEEFRLEIFDYPPVGIGDSMVAFVDNDIVKLLLVKEFKRLAH